jgi:ABC-type uncharacterized transport system involved in gliding motility auxiliary subunit
MTIRRSGMWRTLSSRPLRYVGRAVLMSALFVITLFCVNYLSHRYSVRWDVTEEDVYSLSPQTVQILHGLNEPITVTGFFVSTDSRKGIVQDLLDEYRFHTKHITYELIDPGLKRDTARQYGVRTSGTLFAGRGERQHRVSSIDEQGLTAAILRASREEEKIIYFATEHNESDPQSTGDDGYSVIGARLAKDNYRVEFLSLAALADSVPDSAAALIVAGAQIAFTDVERDLFVNYLASGGRALWLCDPGDGSIENKWLSGWGVRLRNDFIIEPASSVYGDMSLAVVTQHPTHPITRGLAGLTIYFAHARSLDLIEPVPTKLQVSPLMLTSSTSWGETKISPGLPLQYDEGQDVLGPLIVGVAVRDISRGGRLVIFGDTNFVVNDVLSSGERGCGNAELFTNAVNWLTEDESVLAIVPKQETPRRMALTRPQLRLILYSSVVLWPLAILVVGMAIYWARRP